VLAGRLDNVAIYDQALTQAQIGQVMGGDLSLAQRNPGNPLQIADSFPGPAVDTAKWNSVEKGLEKQGPGTAGSIAASINANGQLVISGTANTNYWGGRTLQTTGALLSDFQATVAVDRISLAGSGSAYRSSLWIWGDDTHYLHFSQNIGENGWQYNYSDGGIGAPTGGGINISVLDAIDGDGGAHGMMLVFLPTGATAATIEMYLDGQLVASQNFTNWTADAFRILLTGQGRAAGDTVEAIFDNFQAYGITPEPATLSLLGLGALALVRRRRPRRTA